MKVAVVTCYYQPDYVRSKVMREAFGSQDKVEIVEIKNRHLGLARYPEIFWKLLRVKFVEKPDAFFLTFRGQEILPLLVLISGRKPLWFDEFIVPGAYLKQEKRKSLKYRFKVSVLRIFLPLYFLFLKRCEKIIADTTEHVQISSELSGINPNKYVVVPVGADEDIFYPLHDAKKSKSFRIFYYSSVMQSLLGIPIVLEVAERLKDRPEFEFVLSGGGQKMKQIVEKSIKNGAKIKYFDWIDYSQIPNEMRKSSLCLGGPFGATPQAMKVITGKTFQSLACAMPTVVGENNAAKRYFTDKRNTLIVKQGDIDALLETILWAHDNPNDLKQISKNGRSLYEAKFSSAKINTIIESLIS